MALLGDPLFGDPAAAVEFLNDRDRGLVFEIQIVDRPHLSRLLRVDDQPAPFRGHVVAQGRLAPHPLALATGRRHLVLDAFGDDLPLELGKGEQDVHGEPPHGAGRVELLGDRDEAHLVAVEELHDTGEVQQRPAETIHLVDHHAVDPAGLDVGAQALKSRPVHVAAGEAAIVVVVGQAAPALVPLTGDVGFGRFPLRVEAVELLVESFLRRLARVDGAADGVVLSRGRSRGHRRSGVETSVHSLTP